MFGMKKKNGTTKAAPSIDIPAAVAYRAPVAQTFPTPAPAPTPEIRNYLWNAGSALTALAAALTPALDQARLAAMTPEEYAAAVAKARGALAAAETAVGLALSAARRY